MGRWYARVPKTVVFKCKNPDKLVKTEKRRVLFRAAPWLMALVSWEVIV